MVCSVAMALVDPCNYTIIHNCVAVVVATSIIHLGVSAETDSRPHKGPYQHQASACSKARSLCRCCQVPPQGETSSLEIKEHCLDWLYVPKFDIFVI